MDSIPDTGTSKDIRDLLNPSSYPASQRIQERDRSLKRQMIPSTRIPSCQAMRNLTAQQRISAIAAELGVSWHTVSSIAMRANRRPDRCCRTGPAGRCTGDRVDEHRWAPRRLGANGFVTLIIDLKPLHDQTGPAWLLDMVPGRSAAALQSLAHSKKSSTRS